MADGAASAPSPPEDATGPASPATSSSDDGTVIYHDCALSPAEFWALRDDGRWPAYVISNDPAPKTLEEVSRTEEGGEVTRVARITTVRNPIPALMRGTLGCKDGFTFTVTEKWRRGEFGKDNPMTFHHDPPVFKDRIKISGQQWVEPHPENATGSRIFFQLNVSVTGRGTATTIAKGIEKGSIAGYALLPARALEYHTLRRAAAGANDAAERLTARMTATEDDEEGGARDVTPPLVGKRVQVRGLVGRPELNGSLGTANSFDESTGRYQVVLDTGDGLKVLPDNLNAVDRDDPASLAGKRVAINGLMKRPELNGLVGVLGLYDYEEGRYQVRIEGEAAVEAAAAATARGDQASRRDSSASSRRVSSGSPSAAPTVLQVAIKPANLKLMTDAPPPGAADGDAAASADLLAARAAAAQAAAVALSAGTSLRARLRWRMALMGVRFTRVLEMQQNDEFRLCDARIDDPQNSGFGTNRHTTYRVATQVRNGRYGWMTVRRRFAEFERLRLALLTFLPGVGERLPPLPEKKAISLTAAVIAERVAGLEAFLQVLRARTSLPPQLTPSGSRLRDHAFG